MPRPRHRLRVVVGAAAAALLLGMVPAVRHGAQSLIGAGGSDGPRVTVATWNMCGVTAWGCGEYGGGEQKAKALCSPAKDHGARAILVQEARRGDLDRARAGLGADWQLAFQPYQQLDGAGGAEHVVPDGEFDPVGAGRVAGEPDGGAGRLALVGSGSRDWGATGRAAGGRCARWRGAPASAEFGRVGQEPVSAATKV
ncbi:hypothetical protein [Kitasatospora griseola]